MLDELFFEVVEGGLGVEEGGFEGDADVAALFVENAVEKAAAFVELGVLFSAVGFEVELMKDEVEFFEAGVFIFFRDVVEDVGDLAGEA